MFGFFMFAQPMFADVPSFPGSAGGGGPPGTGKKPDHPRHFENEIEITLLAFLNTQP